MGKVFSDLPEGLDEVAVMTGRQDVHEAITKFRNDKSEALAEGNNSPAEAAAGDPAKTPEEDKREQKPEEDSGPDWKNGLWYDPELGCLVATKEVYDDWE